MKLLNFEEKQIGKLLYCKDKPIYNISESRILNKALMPKYLLDDPSLEAFKKWFDPDFDIDSDDNIYFRVRGLSGSCYGVALSDHYWIKDSDDIVTYKFVSPYFQYYWDDLDKGSSVYRVDDKLRWLSPTELRKTGSTYLNEASSLELCNLCGLKTVKYRVENSSIIVENFTDINTMFEPLYDFTVGDYDKTVEVFGIDGFRMILIDVIVGNDDRHGFNFGWIRDANTGEYLHMAPLFDFDQSFHCNELYDFWARDFVCFYSKVSEDLQNEAKRLLTIIKNQSSIDDFVARAECILWHIDKL